MKTQHTRGPWRSTGRNIWSDGKMLAYIQSFPDVSRDEADSNAALIAEAPAMLEAAKLAATALDWVLNGGSIPPADEIDKALTALNASIRKSEGLS